MRYYFTTTPAAHRHGDLAHSHVVGHTEGNVHYHRDKMTNPARQTIVKVGNDKLVVPVKSANSEDIKAFGFRGLGHKHHTHVDPNTKAETAPC